MKLVATEWRTDGGGEVEMPFDGRYFELLGGFVERIISIPDTDSPPDAGFGVSLVDDRGEDILRGAGALLPVAATKVIYPRWTFPGGYLRSDYARKPYWLRVTLAGVDTAGKTCIYVV